MFISLPPVIERRQILIEKLMFDKILTWPRAFRGKIAIFYDSIVSQFPEETWAQRGQNKCR